MRVVIFEDEYHNAQRLITLLNQYDEKIEVVKIIESVADGLAWIEQRNNVDLIFMDIQLSDGNCFELFSKVTVKTPIIFVTAYDAFCLTGFQGE